MDAARPDQAPWGAFRPRSAARIVLFLCRHTVLGRGRGRVWLARLFLYLHRGPADVMLWGAPARLYGADNRAEWKALARPDRYDRAERDFLAGADWSGGGAYIDIGANAGLYLRDVLMRAPGAPAVAIEPQAEMVRRLCAGLALCDAAGLDLSGRVRVIAAAAGAADASMVLGGDGADAGTRALGLPAAADAPRVPVRPLSALLEQAGVTRIAAMKLDIEGWEDRALIPFLESAPDDLLPRRVVIEHAHRGRWARDCLAALSARNYRIVSAGRMNTLLERAQDAVSDSSAALQTGAG